MPLRSSRTLTLTGATTVLQAALARAGELGVAVNIAVTDSTGGLLTFARMDGAFAHSGPIAQDKARTVCGFAGIPTDELYAGIAAEPAVRDGIALRAGIAAFGGGMPVRVAGELVGAVGVSGASAEQDRDVATAGAAALAASIPSADSQEAHSQEGVS